MMNTKRQEMREEAKADIIEALEDGYDSYLCDLHNEVFNTNYYIVGRQEAIDALDEYGCFTAIREVQEYEQDNFGEVNTDLSDPEKVVNMLYYIVGEEVLDELMEADRETCDNLWNEKLSENECKVLISIFKDVEI